MYKKHLNFLQYIIAHLYGKLKLDEFLKQCTSGKMVSNTAFNKLKELDQVLNHFFKHAKKLSDFELIRREEWDTIISLAQSCLQKLVVIKE